MIAEHLSNILESEDSCSPKLVLSLRDELKTSFYVYKYLLLVIMLSTENKGANTTTNQIIHSFEPVITTTLYIPSFSSQLFLSLFLNAS